MNANQRQARHPATTPGGWPIPAHRDGAASQAMFEAITSSEHKVDLTRPAHKSPSAAERAAWRQTAA